MARFAGVPAGYADIGRDKGVPQSKSSSRSDVGKTVLLFGPGRFSMRERSRRVGPLVTEYTMMMTRTGCRDDSGDDSNDDSSDMIQ